jgi:hypothetical protein
MPPGTSDFGPIVPASALGDVSLVSPPIHEHGKVRRRVRAAGITSPVRVQTIHREATVPLILVGLGAALLTRPLARQAVALRAVECRLDPPLYRQAFLITCRTSSRTPPERFSSSSPSSKRQPSMTPGQREGPPFDFGSNESDDANVRNPHLHKSPSLSHTRTHQSGHTAAPVSRKRSGTCLFADSCLLAWRWRRARESSNGSCLCEREPFE